ncbi:hypothetical protein [Bacillus sp. OxB-1]|uniref:hypothetical protein n=1 Tax=Bacillus sp. (strain OxB-1) TaxID=98228 RepID=UPI0011862CC4|nr:hypothetical protein [Bacillus sp. OxB-1]
MMYCIRLVEERSAVIQGGLFRDITLSGVPAMLYGKLALPGAYYQQLVGDISTLEELSAVVQKNQRCLEIISGRSKISAFPSKISALAQ